jgi:hypothetical protein
VESRAHRGSHSHGSAWRLDPTLKFSAIADLPGCDRTGSQKGSRNAEMHAQLSATQSAYAVPTNP